MVFVLFVADFMSCSRTRSKCESEAASRLFEANIVFWNHQQLLWSGVSLILRCMNSLGYAKICINVSKCWSRFSLLLTQLYIFWSTLKQPRVGKIRIFVLKLFAIFQKYFTWFNFLSDSFNWNILNFWHSSIIFDPP